MQSKSYLVAAVALSAMTTLSCGELLDPFSFRDADETDLEVKTLLGVATQLDRESMGFTALPTTGWFMIVRVNRFKAKPKSWKNLDVALIVEEEHKSRSWRFARAGDSYELVCENETYLGPRVTQHPEIHHGKCFKEFMKIDYATREACNMKPGLRIEVWDSNGRRAIEPDEVGLMLEDWKQVEVEEDCVR